MEVSKNLSFPHKWESNILILLDSRFRESDDCELLEVSLYLIAVVVTCFFWA